jgi:hypothetical protein
MRAFECRDIRRQKRFFVDFRGKALADPLPPFEPARLRRRLLKHNGHCRECVDQRVLNLSNIRVIKRVLTARSPAFS